MTRVIKLCALLSLIVLLAPGVLAQGAPGPRNDDMALVGSLGFAKASDDNFDDYEILFSGAYEYYLDRNLFLRGMIGFTEFEPDEGRGDVEIAIINANIAYGWAFDTVFPFVTGGLGLYDTDPVSSPFDDEVEFGLNVGGGLDVYVADRWAIRFEALFHGYSGDDPDSFGMGQIGAKWLF